MPSGPGALNVLKEKSALLISLSLRGRAKLAFWIVDSVWLWEFGLVVLMGDCVCEDV